MKIKRSICAALAASVALIAPSYATVDAGTPNLIRTAEEYGATFRYNPPGCGGRYLGRYRLSDSRIELCYRGTPGAKDHDTVRHEVWHFVQHCASRRRGHRGYLVPLSRDTAKRNVWISQYLSNTRIQSIRSMYRPAVHDVELEAFAAASHYSANQIAGVLRQWCIKPT